MTKVVDPEADGDKEERQEDIRSHCGDAEISREHSPISVGKRQAQLTSCCARK